jgi:acetoin utilization protein AcuB
VDLRDYEKMPAVGAAMTPFPHFVRADTPITEVEQLMQAHQIRHIPVIDESKVVGIISERDLHRLVNPSLPAVNKKHIRARNVMVAHPYVVETKTPLAQVLAEMADRRIGSAVVVKGGKLAGIFSVTDACRILAHELRTRFPSDNDAA